MTRADQLRLAAEWLKHYDAAPDEEHATEAMEAAVRYLEKAAARLDRESAIRDVARETGKPVSTVRRAIRQARA